MATVELLARWILTEPGLSFLPLHLTSAQDAKPQPGHMELAWKVFEGEIYISFWRLVIHGTSEKNTPAI